MKLFRNHDTSTVTINGIRNNIRIIQHNLCNVIPTSAILEIVSLMDYEEIEFKSDIFRSLQITIDNINVESVNSIPSKEDQLLDLKYDIRLYRRSYFHLKLPPCHEVLFKKNLYPLIPWIYLERHVMRPFCRSYGDISTVTLSPGRIRMKFMRSFPEM